MIAQYQGAFAPARRFSGTLMALVVDSSNFVPCYRHPKRPTGVRCQRCNRPICPRCMVPADVGFHCPRCVYGWMAWRHDIGQWLGGGPRWVRRWRGTALLVVAVAVIAFLLFRR